MSLEKKLGEIAWNALLLPDRAVKTAVDGLVSLISKTSVDRYQVAQTAIIGGGIMAGVSMTGHWLSEPRNVKEALYSAWVAAWDLAGYPFIVTPRIKWISTNLGNVKSYYETVFFGLTRSTRFLFLATGVSELFGFYEGLNNIGIPGAANEWERIMLSAFLYLIDGKTNRWDMAKEWYKKWKEDFQ